MPDRSEGAIRRRVWVGFALAALAGALLGITRAPLWAGVVAVAVLCFMVLPWTMLGGRHGR